MKKELAKADLHVHSRYSTRPSEWVLQKLGCAESYTEPLKLYDMAMERGMDYVTITDHNAIAGSLDIAHLENTFISEEITTYFPEDRCKIHVLAHNITETHHHEITKCRENIYDLVAYLNQENIFHAVAHPLFSINGRLTFEYFEQQLLLFKTFELNGSRDSYQNNILVKILENLTREKIDALINKYQLEPYTTEPWVKNIIAGSDDHSGLNIARYYTEVENVSSINEFLNGILQQRSRVGGRTSSPKTMAHTLYSIAYQFYSSKFNIQKYTNDESLLRFADRALTPFSQEEQGMFHRLRSYLGYRRPNYLYKSKAKTMQGMLLKEARDIIYQDPHMKEILHHNNHQNKSMDDVWFRFVNRISEQISTRFADSILDSFSGANLFDIFNTIGSAGSLYTMLAPYFVAYGLFTKDRQFCRDYHHYETQKTSSDPKHRLKVAHFTDTFYEVNGVAKTLRKQVEASRRLGKQLSIITCSPRDDTPGVVNFYPIGTFEMPEYRELKLYYPPLLRMLDYCYHQNFTLIHSATPGPIGLAAIIIARILKLPLHTTYHTALPQYADQLTEDPAMGEVMWRYMAWYYNQSERVFVPSRATGRELIQKGIQKEKIRFYPRGIDVERFHPSNRNGYYKSNFNIADDIFKLLYVGRISKEKNLHFLTDIFKQIAEQRQNTHLILVGDGPYVPEMKEELSGCPVTFTGYLEGDALCQAFASGDLFIFPSTTDTFGNVVLEAQASGLPVIVTDEGGPSENIIPGETGFVLKANNPAPFVEKVFDLMDNKILLNQMRLSAREYMEDRTFESAFLEQWDGYRNTDL
jgi:glycosyltransferase involved in cell wall biosynthesis